MTFMEEADLMPDLMPSCVCGFYEEEVEQDASSFVGALYEVSGALLSHIPPPATKGADILTMNDKPVRVAVLKSGELQLTSLISSNNKEECTKNARQAHLKELKEVREALKLATADKQSAEEEYSGALGCDSDNDDNDDSTQDKIKEQGTELLKRVAQEKALARKLAKLEHMETLTVKFATRGGTAATLQPGIVTAVPFATIPVVWCPKSLAKAMPLDDTFDELTVPAAFELQLNVPSQILSECMLADLSAMLPHNDNGANSMVLHKLHDQTAGITNALYDKFVRPHGNVLTLIQSNTGQVFGGFYVDPMGSGSGWHKGHDHDFVFSLGKTDDKTRTPVKLLKPKGYGGNAVNRGCGLHMSVDLIAFCAHQARIPRTYTEPAEGYPSLPPGKSIAGAPGNYTPTKMEVYQLLAAS